MSRPSAWREQFFADMGREGIKAETSARFLRVAATMQRLAEDKCNGTGLADNGKPGSKPCKRCDSLWHSGGLRRDGVCIDCHNDDRARVLQVRYLPGWTIELQGDPRGCVLKLKTPQGREIDVP